MTTKQPTIEAIEKIKYFPPHLPQAAGRETWVYFAQPSCRATSFPKESKFQAYTWETPISL